MWGDRRLVVDLSPYAVRPEGVSIITLNGEERILFVEDRYRRKAATLQTASIGLCVCSTCNERNQRISKIHWQHNVSAAD
jgi:hypothetical protein